MSNGWNPMETAPKDGTVVRLLVQFTEHNLQEGLEEVPTIGVNCGDYDGEPEWKFAGWDWTNDRFTQGEGTPIGWLPLEPEPIQKMVLQLGPTDDLVQNIARLRQTVEELQSEAENNNIPVEYRQVGGRVYAVHGSSSIDFVRLLEAQIDIALRYFHGEWQDPANLAADYGGLGAEKSELCRQAATVAERLYNATKQLSETTKIVNAAKNLVKVRGRYHSEQAYVALAAALGMTVPPAQTGVPDNTCKCMKQHDGEVKPCPPNV